MIIRDIVESTDRYNFHSHTQFCDGRVSMEEMVKAAVDAGFRHWGFSPHSPVPIESSCNMSKSDVPAYLQEVDRLRTIFGDRINLYASMEIDYLGDDWGPSDSYFKELPLDYRIGSVHFVPSRDGMIDVDGRLESFIKKMECHFDNDIRYVVNAFYDESEAMIDKGGFDIIGHFDKIGHNASGFCPGIEEQPWYKERVNGLIDKIIDKSLIVEINTKAWSSAQRIFPRKEYLERLSKEGILLVVNSDAHYPDKVNEGREYGLSLLKNC